MQTTLSFLGAAGAVTGSHFLLETGGAKLLVDCGLRQGIDEERNWEAFPYAPSEISHLFVTHAHLDHMGLIPKLVKDGFQGQIISTKATRALVEPMLYDAMELLRHHSQRLNRPELYGEKDIAHALSLWKGIGYREPQDVGDGVTAELFDAGHILGSAMVRLSRGEQAIGFTGDLGGGNSPLLSATDELPKVQYLVMEGTYGDKMRSDDKSRIDRLEDVIEDTAARGGTLVIPAFSTERTQDLLFDIRKLMLEKRIPELPVYLDSPLAEKITNAYLEYPEYFSPEICERAQKGEKIFSFPQLHFVGTQDESRGLDGNNAQKIILAGSGMSSGGRVFGHERRFLPDPNSTVLIVGYQAVGTIGRQLIEGVKSIQVRGGNESIPVRARVETLYGYSAHRDSEALLEFANKATSRGTRQIFVVHGEPASTMFLSQRIRDYLGAKASAPEAGEKAVIEF